MVLTLNKHDYESRNYYVIDKYVVADLVVIFGSEKNNTCKLQYYWHGWHGSIGRKVKPLFEEYVNLTNEAARLNSKADIV